MMEDDLKKWRQPKKNENGRRPQFCFEKLEWRPQKNGRRHQKNKQMEDDLKIIWKTNPSTKISLIGCDTIVNSPSAMHCVLFCTFQQTDIVTYRAAITA